MNKLINQKSSISGGKIDIYPITNKLTIESTSYLDNLKHGSTLCYDGIINQKSSPPNDRPVEILNAYIESMGLEFEFTEKKVDYISKGECYDRGSTKETT